MKAVVQRVGSARVLTNEGHCHKINKGMVILVGITHGDEKEDVDWLVRKILGLRIFDDEAGVMNLNLEQVGGELMVVSQFTLHARTKKGNRPSYVDAAGPDKAIPFYEYFLEEISRLSGQVVAHGVFGAHMRVELMNDGPVTLIIDTDNKI